MVLESSVANRSRDVRLLAVSLIFAKLTDLYNFLGCLNTLHPMNMIEESERKKFEEFMLLLDRFKSLVPSHNRFHNSNSDRNIIPTNQRIDRCPVNQLSINSNKEDLMELDLMHRRVLRNCLLRIMVLILAAIIIVPTARQFKRRDDRAEE
jgi:hypothetical protein